MSNAGGIVESSRVGMHNVREALRSAIREREMGVSPGHRAVARRFIQNRFSKGVGKNRRTSRRGIVDPNLRTVHEAHLAAGR